MVVEKSWNFIDQQKCGNPGFSMIRYWHGDIVCVSVCLYICNIVHCGAESLYRRLKVVPLCSYGVTSYSLVQTLAVGCINFWVYPKHDVRFRSAI